MMTDTVLKVKFNLYITITSYPDLESSIQEEENKTSGNSIAKARPSPKSTVMSTSNSVFHHERRWIDIDTIKSVLKCQKPLPDNCGIIFQFLEDLTEQSSTMISSKSAGRGSSTIFRNDHLKIGYQCQQNVEEHSKDINIA